MNTNLVCTLNKMKELPIPLTLAGWDPNWVPREPSITKLPTLGEIYGTRPKYGLGKCGHYERQGIDYTGETFKDGSPVIMGPDKNGWIVECQKCHWSWTVTKDRVVRRGRGLKCSKCEK
jgi:hypothetical protein